MVTVVFDHDFGNGREQNGVLTCPSCGWYDRAHLASWDEEWEVIPDDPIAKELGQTKRDLGLDD